MKDYFMRSTQINNPRFRSKMVKVFDTYYFKELTKQELVEAGDELYKTVDSVHTEDELNKFMGSQVNKELPEDTV